MSNLNLDEMRKYAEQAGNDGFEETSKRIAFLCDEIEVREEFNKLVVKQRDRAVVGLKEIQRVFNGAGSTEAFETMADKMYLIDTAALTGV